MSQAGLIDIEASHPQVPTSFTTNAGTAIPIANNLEILGTNGLTTSASGKTVTVTGVAATAGATSGAATVGVASFDSAHFTVTAGFVQLFGGIGMETFLTDDGAPAVEPNGSGQIELIGGIAMDVNGQGPDNKVTFNAKIATSFQTINYNLDNVLITPRKLSDAFASPTEIGGTTPNIGNFTTVFATNFDTNVAAAGVTLTGTTLSADGTDANIPITITPKGTEAVTIDGLDYPMADGNIGEAVITNGAGVLSFASMSGGVYAWTEVTAAAVALAVNNGYVMNRGTAITATLPATAAFGSIIRIAGKGAGLTVVAQNAGQTIHFGSADTTTGVGGSLTATGQYDTIEMVCITADTDWEILSSIGTWTIT